MDADLTTETKVVNGILIVAGVLTAGAAGWWVGHPGLYTPLIMSQDFVWACEA